MTVLYSIGDFVDFVEPKPAAVPVPKLWYMLKLHPNYDMKAERQLNERGVTVYLPKETQRRRTTFSRYRWCKLPIFPGILFIPDFDANLTKLKQLADGIGGFVRSDGQALPVSAWWMDKIRRFEAKLADTPNRGRVTVGQRVRIVGGPWDLWEGRISRVDPRDRIMVLIRAMIGEVPVEIDASQVEVVAEAGKSARRSRH